MERFTQHNFRTILEFLRASYWISDFKAFAAHIVSALPKIASRSQNWVPPAERDRLVLRSLRPHVVEAYRTAEASRRIRAALAGATRALDQLHLGVMVLTPDARLLFANVRARRCLVEYFDGQRADRLPEAIDRWIRHHNGRHPTRDTIPRACEPLVVDREGKRLVVRLLSNAAQNLLLLDEQKNGLEATLLESLGLTAREAQVLMWLVEGKTNRAIGTILRISPRTVQKHLERVYVKLGVETRTAAAAQALRAMRD
jgi:DNA-binding CsgD family transcriptional regulator